MSNSVAVQEARKKMQLARLEQKGKKGYSEYYANQPLQVVKAKKNAEWHAARDASRAADEALEIAEVTGEGLAAAQETAAVAKLVAERSHPSYGKSHATSNLTGA